MSRRKETGNLAENLAADYLSQKGLKILERNFKTKLGEIDILAKDRKTLVLVEVKSKTSDKFSQPSEMVTWFKQKKLRQLASQLAVQFPHQSIRIDVVTVDLQSPGEPKIEHLVSAVEEK